MIHIHSKGRLTSVGCARTLWDDIEPREYFGDWDLPPNSCGRRCSKTLPCQERGLSSTHQCNTICHAGPCPPCPRGCRPSRTALRKLVKARLAPSQLSSPQEEQTTLQLGPRISMIRPREETTVAPTFPDDAQVDRDSSVPPVRLTKGDHTRTVLSLISTSISISAVAHLTMVVVKPYKNQLVAENNNAVRAIWAFTALSGCINAWINFISMRSWTNLLKITSARVEVLRRLRFQPPFSTFVGVILMITYLVWCVVSFAICFGWVLGPIFRYVTGQSISCISLIVAAQ